MKRWLIGAAAVLGGLVLVFVLWSLISGGVFRSIEPHGPRCERIEGLVGAEDITVNRDRGWAYVSAFDRRAHMSGEGVEGDIFRLSVASSTITRLQHDLPGPFMPHGLSLHVDDAGRETLVVINHGDGHAVEIFDVDGPRLRHRRTVKDDLLRSPNDVHAVGPDRFFVTNDHHYGPGAMQVIEDFGQRAWGTLVAFDGTRMSVAWPNTAYANGVQGSLDGRTLYLAETVGRRLHIFDRTDMQLSLRETIELDTGPDNIEVDERGRLWIGAHPKLLAFVAHSRDAASRAPSQVLRVTLGSGAPTIEEVYLDEGDPLSAAAVAAVSKDRMILGPVFDPSIMSCPRPE